MEFTSELLGGGAGDRGGVVGGGGGGRVSERESEIKWHSEVSYPSLFQ